MNRARKRQPAMITDAQRRAFFYYLKAAGYSLPGEKDQAYADLGITSTKDMSAAGMEIILRKLRRGTTGTVRNRSFTPEEKPQERFEEWRAAFFPENIVAFGSDPKKRVISKKQQDFILANALRVFRSPGNFRAWMRNWHGVEVIISRAAANVICRGLNAVAERGGYDPAPPPASASRRDWEYRHRSAGFANNNKEE